MLTLVARNIHICFAGRTFFQACMLTIQQSHLLRVGVPYGYFLCVRATFRYEKKPNSFKSLRPSHTYMRRILNHHWFEYWLVIWLVPSHYLNQCRNIVKRTPRNKRQWNFNRQSYIFIQEMLLMMSAKWQPFDLGPNVLRRQLDAWRLYTDQLLLFLLQSYVYFRHIPKLFR